MKLRIREHPKWLPPANQQQLDPGRPRYIKERTSWMTKNQVSTMLIGDGICLLSAATMPRATVVSFTGYSRSNTG